MVLALLFLALSYLLFHRSGLCGSDISWHHIIVQWRLYRAQGLGSRVCLGLELRARRA